VHAVVVKVSIQDVERGEEMLREQVVPRVSQAPGFVAGYWTRADDNGLSMIILESEDAARAVADRLESEGLPNDFVTVDGIEVREVVANA